MHGYPFWFGFLLSPVFWYLVGTLTVVLVYLVVKLVLRLVRIDRENNNPVNLG